MICKAVFDGLGFRALKSKKSRSLAARGLPWARDKITITKGYGYGF